LPWLTVTWVFLLPHIRTQLLPVPAWTTPMHPWLTSLPRYFVIALAATHRKRPSKPLPIVSGASSPSCSNSVRWTRTHSSPLCIMTYQTAPKVNKPK
jgi:hypothetical protein